MSPLRKPKGTLLFPDSVDYVEEEWKGKLSDLDNVEIRVKCNGKDIKQNPPTCDFCGERMSFKEVKAKIDHIGISKLPIYDAQHLGKYREKRAKLNEKIKKGKLSIEEAFRLDDELSQEFSSRKSVDSTEHYSTIVCNNCGNPMGSLHVVALAVPRETPESPTTDDYLKLKKSPSTLRYLHNFFRIPSDVTLEDWMEGKDVEEAINQLKASHETLRNLPGYGLSEATSMIFNVIRNLEEEVRQRKGKVFMELKTPGLSTKLTIESSVIELHDQGLSENEIVERLGARPLIVHMIIQEHEKGREIARKAREGDYARERRERRIKEEVKWR